MDSGLVTLPLGLLSAAQPSGPLSSPLLSSRLSPRQTSRRIRPTATARDTSRTGATVAKEGKSPSRDGEDSSDEDVVALRQAVKPTGRGGASLFSQAAVSVTPQIITFSGYNAGETLRRQVSLTNAAFASQRMQAALVCSSGMFALEGDNPGILAPGANGSYFITFTAPIDEELLAHRYSTTLRVVTECGIAEVAVEANPAAPALRLPSVIDFGTVQLLDTETRMIDVKNSGIVPFDITVHVLQEGKPEFTVSHAEPGASSSDTLALAVPAGGVATFLVNFSPFRQTTNSVDVIVKANILPTYSYNQASIDPAIVCSAAVPPPPIKITLLGSAKPSVFPLTPVDKPTPKHTTTRGIDAGRIISQARLQHFKETAAAKMLNTLQDRVDAGGEGKAAPRSRAIARDSAPFEPDNFTARDGYLLPGRLDSHGATAFVLTQQAEAVGGSKRLKPYEIAAAVAEKRRQQAMMTSIQRESEAIGDAAARYDGGPAFGLAGSDVSKISSGAAVEFTATGATAFSRTITAPSLVSTLLKTSWLFPFFLRVQSSHSEELDLAMPPMQSPQLVLEDLLAVQRALVERSAAAALETGHLLDYLINASVHVAAGTDAVDSELTQLQQLLRTASEVVGVKCDSNHPAGVDAATFDKLMFDFMMEAIRKDEETRDYSSAPVRGDDIIDSETLATLAAIKRALKDVELLVTATIRSLRTTTVSSSQRTLDYVEGDTLARVIYNIPGLRENIFPSSVRPIVVKPDAVGLGQPHSAWDPPAAPEFDMSQSNQWDVRRDAVSGLKQLVERCVVQTRVHRRLAAFRARLHGSKGGQAAGSVVSQLQHAAQEAELKKQASDFLVPAESVPNNKLAKAAAGLMSDLVPEDFVPALPWYPESILPAGQQPFTINPPWAMIESADRVIPSLASAADEPVVPRSTSLRDIPFPQGWFTDVCPFPIDEEDDITGPVAWKLGVAPSISGVGPVALPVVPWECPPSYATQPLREYRLDESFACGPASLPLPQSQFDDASIDERTSRCLSRADEILTTEAAPIGSFSSALPAVSCFSSDGIPILAVPTWGVHPSKHLPIPPGIILPNIAVNQMNIAAAPSQVPVPTKAAGKDAAAKPSAETGIERDSTGLPITAKSVTLFHNLPRGHLGMPIESNVTYHLDPTVSLNTPYTTMPLPPPSSIFPPELRVENLLASLPPAMVISATSQEISLAVTSGAKPRSRSGNRSTVRSAASASALTRSKSQLPKRADLASKDGIPSYITDTNPDAMMNINGEYISLGQHLACVPGFASLRAQQEPHAGLRKSRNGVATTLAAHFQPSRSRALLCPSELLLDNIDNRGEDVLPTDVTPYAKRDYEYKRPGTTEWAPAWRKLVAATVDYPALLPESRPEHLQSDDSESEPDDTVAAAVKRSVSFEKCIEPFLHPLLRSRLGTVGRAVPTEQERAAQEVGSTSAKLHVDNVAVVKDLLCGTGGRRIKESYTSDGLPIDTGSVSDGLADTANRFII